jgi:hypothetical protein
MSRRTERAATEAANAASEAARTLAQRSHEARQERAEPPAAPPPPPEAPQAEKAEKPEKKVDGNRIHELKQANPRNKLVEELIEKRGMKADEPAEAPKPEVTADAPKTEQAPDPAAAPAAEATAPAKVKQVVNGEEFEVEPTELEAAGGERAWRMNKAAELQLDKAKKVLEEAQKSRVDIGQLVQALRQPQAPEKPKESDEQFIASKIDIIRFGTPEEAAKAQVEIMQRSNKPVDANAIIEAAAAKIAHDSAVKEFDREFQDLVTNPILLNAVVAERSRRLQERQAKGVQGPIDWPSFYRTIGTELRSAFGRSSQPAATTLATTAGTPSQQSDKEARKASIVPIPTAAARAELPKEEKEPTREEIIAEMRKKRISQVG